MKDLINKTLNLAQLKGAEYADIRIVNGKRESIAVKGQVPEAIEINQSQGFGVRVLYKGSWGFSSSCFLDGKNIEKTVKQAMQIAKASLLVQNEKVKLAPTKKIIAKYQTKIEKDPFEISLEQKLKLLLGANAEIQKIKAVKLSESFMNFWKQEKIFASTEGSFIEQEIIESGAGIEATAITKNDVQTRSFPNSFKGQCGTGGYELIEAIKLKENAQRIGEEAIILLKSPQCPVGINTLILDNDQLGLQIHESCGHPIELDRVLGMEASYAGTSFLTLEKLGKFKYGSDI
ncbi:MAG: TldD/PmbA family protein, partial [Patescibacteria group bacterium]